MKKNIYKINQYLLENYPTIWNTRIVWMTLISLVLHLVFFGFGCIALTNPQRLHSYGAKSVFFENGTVFFSIIISVLLLVIWLVYLFKNNSFKNFYPNSRGKLFAQFISYLFIIFIGSTFYISYTYGVKTYIKNKYPDAEMAKEIQIANDASIFFSHSINDYEVDERRYPFPLDTTYWETKSIDYRKPYLKWLDIEYQLYAIKSKVLTNDKNYNDSIYNGYIYNVEKDSSSIYYYKDTVVDLTKYKSATILQKKKNIIRYNEKHVKDKHVKIESYKEIANRNDLAIPSYYNYSSFLYDSDNDAINYRGYDRYKNENRYSNGKFYAKHKEMLSKRAVELLQRNNPEEIKSLLAQFLAIANKYKVDYNLNAEKWFKLVYHPSRFEVKVLIRTQPNTSEGFTNAVAEETLKEKFIREHTTNYYIKTDNVKSAFTNIDDIKTSNAFLDSFHFFIWFSFVLAMLVFIFRISGIKLLIFSAIAGGLIATFIGMMTILFNYLRIFRGYRSEEYFAFYLSLIIINIVLVITIFYTDRFRKSVMTVFANLSLSVFIGNVFLIIGLISLHQRDACHRAVGDSPCFNLLEWIGGTNLSFLLFGLGVVFVYFYSGIIKKIKGLPEE